MAQTNPTRLHSSTQEARLEDSDAVAAGGGGHGIRVGEDRRPVAVVDGALIQKPRVLLVFRPCVLPRGVDFGVYVSVPRF